MDNRTPGPWRTGRTDMQSYSGDGEPFASIYCDDDRAKIHLGERLPYVIARCPGNDCKANAEFIVRAVNSHEDLVAALEWALYQVEDGGFNSVKGREAQAALAKARPAIRGGSFDDE